MSPGEGCELSEPLPTSCLLYLLPACDWRCAGSLCTLFLSHAGLLLPCFPVTMDSYLPGKLSQKIKLFLLQIALAIVFLSQPRKVTNAGGIHGIEREAKAIILRLTVVEILKQRCGVIWCSPPYWAWSSEFLCAFPTSMQCHPQSASCSKIGGLLYLMSLQWLKRHYHSKSLVYIRVHSLLV